MSVLLSVLQTFAASLTRRPAFLHLENGRRDVYSRHSGCGCEAMCLDDVLATAVTPHRAVVEGVVMGERNICNVTLLSRR